jgi:hypothetical protein
MGLRDLHAGSRYLVGSGGLSSVMTTDRTKMY